VNEEQFGNYHAEERLPDGRLLNIRAIRPDDKVDLQEGLRQLSPQSQYFRFFTHKEKLTAEELAYFTELDFVDHVGLVATVLEHDKEVGIGVGRYIVNRQNAASKIAEFAVVVDEKFRRLGVGKTLLKHLVQIAKINGISHFNGYVLPENWIMMMLIENSGLPATKKLNEAGVFEYTVTLLPT
jgi:GNAT superfamily N-acetyltransferase